ncbi:MAG: BamA/TamA family outer membrane protein [Candidatus Eisenbacteria bacterium]
MPDPLRAIASVHFEGQKGLGRKALKAANLKTRKPSRLPWKPRRSLRLDYLRSDTAAIANLYRHYGYLDAHAVWRLEPTSQPGAARVVFVIEEGQRSHVRNVVLNGLHAFTQRELQRSLLARPGVPFDPAYLQLDTLKIRNLYQERGHLPGVRASARRDDTNPLAVDVTYDVEEGLPFRVGEISYQGGGHVRESLARRELLVKPGDVYRRSRLDRSIERLYETTLFNQVQFTPLPDSGTHLVGFTLRVGERRPRWVDVGVGSGTTERFRATGEWGHRNLDTRALRAIADGELDVDGRAKFRKSGVSASLVEPWMLGLRLSGQATAFYLLAADRTDRRYVLHSDTRGVRFTLFREMNRIVRYALAEENSVVHQDYDILDPNLPDSTREELRNSVVPRYRTNILRLTVERDLRDARIAASRGSMQTLLMELSGGPLKGSSSYRKLQLGSTWYTPLPNGWTLASRAIGGVISPFGDVANNFSPDAADQQVARVPRPQRFFVGGPNSLRGYEENSIPLDGGLAMVLANLEFRVPLYGPFGLEVFLDAGNVWDRLSYIKAGDLVLPWQAGRERRNDLRYTYGVGGRLVLPFGPLRVDLAWSDRSDFPHSRGVPFSYQFAIGPSF